MQSKPESNGVVVINGDEYKYGIDTAKFPELKKAKTGRRESGRLNTLFLGQRVSRVAACNHKVVPQSVPHTKCFDCWHLYFSLNAREVYASFEFLRTGKEAELVAKHGTKFVRQFKKFVTHVQNIAPIQAEDVVAQDGGN